MGLFRMPCHADLAENCVTILPGTHSKHIHIRSRKIEAIETFMSGECLEVLSQHSILSANADMEVLWKQGFQWTCEEQKKAFTDGVHRSARRGLLGNLFQTRTRGVLHQHPSSTNVWFLVGLLIGEEWVTFKDHHSETFLSCSPRATSSATSMIKQPDTGTHQPYPQGRTIYHGDGFITGACFVHLMRTQLSTFSVQAFWEMPLVVIMRGFPTETAKSLTRALSQGGLQDDRGDHEYTRCARANSTNHRTA